MNASSHTISSYRDTFKIFLNYCQAEKNLKPELVQLSMVTKELIIDFLDWLERERQCSISTRNQRLAAIHSFLSYVQKDNPETLFEIQRTLSIPTKKKPKPVIPFLTAAEMEILLNQPDRTKESGRRDLVLLAVLYDTGARVQELIDLTIKDIRLDKPAVIKLHGKGKKSRQVPITKNTVALLEGYLKNYDGNRGCSLNDCPVFYNQHRTKLTRRGVSYILNKYVDMAREEDGFYSADCITPHVFRHSRAVHMLESGINLVYIRDFLGHVSVTSTEIYARANNEMKRKALEEAYLELDTGNLPSWEKDGELMNWLQNLCR